MAPSYMPFFSVDQQTGDFGLNSEGSVANAKLQQLLIDRDRPRTRITPEHKIQAIRQKGVDVYYEGEKIGDKVTLGGKPYTLPMISSPLTIFIGQNNASPKEVERQRSEQARGFRGNFLQTFGKGVYEEIDEAMLIVEKRKTEVLEKRQKSSWKKPFQSSQWTSKESQYIFDPLHEAIQYLNKRNATNQIPLQIRWREFWKTEDRKVEDVFMIFPNTMFEAQEPMSAWSGMVGASNKDVFL